MRKPRDFDLELKALADKAKQLKERRVQQLGELVIATGADATDAESLAGALLVIAETSEAQRKEAWRKRGWCPTRWCSWGRPPLIPAAGFPFALARMAKSSAINRPE
jgi:hypothetical protein